MAGSLFPQGDTLMALALLVPFLAAFLIPLFRGNPNVREFVTLAAAGALFDLVVILAHKVLNGEFPALPALEVLPGLEIRFAIEPLGMLFALVASTLWIANSIYSIGYMRGNNEPRQTPFYICFAVAIFATIGIAFSANLFTLFLFYELLTLSTYPLVTHKGNDDAKAAGRVYLILLLATSMLLLLPAIIWTGVVAGTLDFTPGGILAGKVEPALMGVLLLLFVYGIGKAALMPVHFWLPAAMVAPTPVSALLHAVAVVKAGVFTVVKVIVYIFGVETLRETGAGDWLVYLAGFTVIVASIVALAPGQPEEAAGVFHRQPAFLRHPGGRDPDADFPGRGGDAHRRARGFQDHALLRRRLHIHRRAPDRDFPAQRHRPSHALDDGRLHHRRAVDDRPAADGRFPWQVVHADRRGGDAAMVPRRGHHGIDGAERGLFPADHLQGLLQGTARPRRRTPGSRRSALADRGGADGDRGRHHPAVHVPAGAVHAGGNDDGPALGRI